MNGVETEGLVDTGAEVSIFKLYKKFWNLDWSLQEVYTQFIEIGKTSQ